MDKLADEWIKTVTERLFKNLFKTLKVFDVENVMPLMLTRGQLNTFIGLNPTRINELIDMKDFPIVRVPGKQDRYPRDAVKKWIDENWERIEK
ncbi:hypothetical protein Javan425_0052 [Streptococcus phage Javan425]|uniref:DNA-binding protein n=1 Tax=Streptococcus porcinus str. Jelinkova 176 TaxID=873448 RepID=A0ABN0CWE9_STRPO|nr:hypothetical protein [Streptococcus porcinus]EGJ27644.1 hypothetical protein STRPO_0251 [Streptococcus porcinus str. Jelinkova 176]QBX18353.1 hypothetical protein Javan423_0007 [Streptococcus phage Javan423]QBX18457.1 hypothetical protein Javan425_0052 [Streptococcus phage Javan425]SQG43930.1 putative DNA-binding phage protein [Streptococcus porcinus]